MLAELRRTKVEVSYWATDIARPRDRARLIDGVRERYGAVNLLVNNAGRAPRVRADLLEASEESFEELIRTNLQGPYFLTQAIAREQLARRQTGTGVPGVDRVRDVGLGGSSRRSIAATTASARPACRWPRGSSRCASPSTAFPCSRCRPGIIETDMTAGVRETYDRRIADGLVPARRWGLPEDVGRTVRALVAGDLAYATGSVIAVDGGLSIPRL